MVLTIEDLGEARGAENRVSQAESSEVTKRRYAE
jgi:hypothetical protein